MSEHELRHLAVITGTAPEHPEDIGRAVLASCGKAGEIAREAFALVPGLRAFSWLDPGLDGLLARAAAPVAARACAAGARALAAAAADLGVSLRLCGRVGRPARRGARPAGARADGRTLLWFQRYSGQGRDRPCGRALSRGAPRRDARRRRTRRLAGHGGHPGPGLAALRRRLSRTAGRAALAGLLRRNQPHAGTDDRVLRPPTCGAPSRTITTASAASAASRPLEGPTARARWLLGGHAAARGIQRRLREPSGLLDGWLLPPSRAFAFGFLPAPRGFASSACAAASRAIGTRNGLHET